MMTLSGFPVRVFTIVSISCWRPDSALAMAAGTRPESAAGSKATFSGPRSSSRLSRLEQPQGRLVDIHDADHPQALGDGLAGCPA